MSTPKPKPTACPPRAILRAIERCMGRCNPAVVETPKFAVHARKTYEDLTTQTLVINIIDKTKIEEEIHQ
jgi:hypothetical protein